VPTQQSPPAYSRSSIPPSFASPDGLQRSSRR
jgi:hypothetical protein